MDKEFIQILAAALGVTDQESLQAKVQELGEEGLKTMYGYYQQIKESGADINKSVELMKQAYNKITGVTMNKLGSKLNYIKRLRGECPEGYEAVKFAQGGQIKTECKKCGGNITNKVKPTKARFAGSGVDLKKEHKGSTDGSGQETTREWKDGTYSTKITGVDTPKGKRTSYVGRRGEQGFEGTAKGDSLKKADWEKKVVQVIPRQRR